MAGFEGLAKEFAERGTALERDGSGTRRSRARDSRASRIEEHADLLVTGSHGHKGLSDVVFGATVSGVRHLVTCPILTVPPLRRR
jgi:nucleotide-binding universal stress UspA family protein